MRLKGIICMIENKHNDLDYGMKISKIKEIIKTDGNN